MAEPVSQDDLDLLAQGGPNADNFLQRFPLDIQVLIVQQLAPKEILRLCETSHYFNMHFCRNDPHKIWERLYHRDISTFVLPPVIDGSRNYRQEYLRIMSHLKTLDPEEADRFIIEFGYEQLLFAFLRNNPSLAYRYQMIKLAMVMAARIGNQEFVTQLVNLGADNFNETMIAAASRGSLPIVDQMITLGQQHPFGSCGPNDFNAALFAAVRNQQLEEGHRQVIDRLIEKGANNFNGVVAIAAYSGHLDIIDRMVALGAYDFNGAMGAAGQGGHSEIITKLMELGATDVNDTLLAAATSGHLDIVKWMIREQRQQVEAGIQTEMAAQTDLNGALANAAYEGHQDIVDYLLEVGANDFNGARGAAVQGASPNSLAIFNQMLALSANNGQTVDQQDFSDDFEMAASQGNLAIINRLIELQEQARASGQPFTHFNLDRALSAASGHGYLQVVNRLIELGANNLNAALFGAARFGQLKIVQRLIEAGATDIKSAIAIATNRHPRVGRYLQSLLPPVNP